MKETEYYQADEFYEKIIEKLNEYEDLNSDDLEYMKNWDIHNSQFHKNRIDKNKTF